MHTPTEHLKIRIENAKYVLAIKSRIKDQQLLISKLKDDVQYWMKRASANGYRSLDRRNDK